MPVLFTFYIQGVLKLKKIPALKCLKIFERRLVYTLYSVFIIWCCLSILKPLKPNDPYRGRTAPLTSKRFILYIYSTNMDTEYFKHCIYSAFFPFQNAICFIILAYVFPVLFTLYIQGVLKLKLIIPAPKG